MHHSRRRKKRASYGVRAVEISRGKNGFGFTISGQAPCILSCIVNGSPAERAGLRPGDFLIAVNGLNVSKVLHDDVVKLIGNTTGVLKLQIAENYYSDSSDEEPVVNVRTRTKFPHRLRHRQQNVCRAEKVVRDLQTGALFVDHMQPIRTDLLPGSKPRLVVKHVGPIEQGTFYLNGRSNKALLDLIMQQKGKDSRKQGIRSIHDFSAFSTQSSKQGYGVSCAKRKESKNMASSSKPGSSSAQAFQSVFTEQELNSILYPSVYIADNPELDLEDESHPNALLRAVVGYLGTIEMPKEPQLPSSRLQAIRNCIRRLRIEKKIHTLVLLSVFPESVLLTNPHGLMLAEFPAEKITFSGVYHDDKKFFGLVTSHGASSDELSEGSQEGPVSISSSCHVFLVDPRLQPHHMHLKRAQAFRISCTPHPVTRQCQEFPDSAEIILAAIVGLYRNRLGINVEAAPGLAEFNAHISPQPSNTSSNSSNSDSGIGFRDEGNTSDRVFVVDVENYNRYRTNSLDRQSFSVPSYNLLRNSPLRCHPNIQAAPEAMPRPPSAKASTSASSNNTLLTNTLKTQETPVPDVHQPSTSSDRLNVRAMPNISGTSSQDAKLDLEVSVNVKSGQSKSSTDRDSRLSPKVFGLDFPIMTLSASPCARSSSRSMDDLHSLQSTIESSKPEKKKKDGFGPKDTKDFASAQVEQSFESTRKWARTSSLRRHLRRKRSLHRTSHDASGTMSDGELGRLSPASSSSSLHGLEQCLHLLPSDASSTVSSSCNSEMPVDCGRVGSWATGFNRLLEDPAGLQTFTEFLKKEFSQENILFWTACENYKKLIKKEEMEQAAQKIFREHLSVGALEAVNVDSHARQVAQEGLQDPTKDIFLLAQKQIFNLMKFDCYQRFLKSSLFKECMLQEMQGQPLPFPGTSTLPPDEDGEGVVPRGPRKDEERRRKSLLPWTRHKSKVPAETSKKSVPVVQRNSILRRSQKKKKKETITLAAAKVECETPSDLSRSRSSLASSDHGDSQQGSGVQHTPSRESLNSSDLSTFPCASGGESNVKESLCRFILPDSSTTVLRTQQGETLGNVLQRLLEKRGLAYTATDAFLAGSDKTPVDQNLDASSLSCREVRVEQRVLFRCDLPSGKTLGVKAKPGRTCHAALKSILLKYGLKVEDVKLYLAGTNTLVSHSTPVQLIDNQRLIVKSCQDSREPSDWDEQKQGLREWSERMAPVLDEVTNQIFESLRKGKAMQTRSTSRSSLLNVSCRAVGTESKKCEQGVEIKPLTKGPSALPKNPLLDYIRASPITTQMAAASGCGKADSAELLDVWKRAQSSRLDDQRGTEINSELPEFLRVDPSNNSVSGSGMVGKENCPSNGSKKDLGLGVADISSLRCLDHNFGGSSVLSSRLKAEEYFSTTFVQGRPSLGMAQYRAAMAEHRLSPSITGATGAGLKSRSASCLLNQGGTRYMPSRPASNPLPHLMQQHYHLMGGQRVNSMSPVYHRLPPSFRHSPSDNIDDILLNSIEQLDLDFDLDMTLKASSPPLTSDESFTPTKISPGSPQEMNSSLHEDTFPSPSSLKETGDYFLPPPGRRLKNDPPPLPPKIKSRGPPPRPPSRQMLNATPTFSDEGCSVSAVPPPHRHISSKPELLKRKVKLTDCAQSEKFNISFV